jgi:hypothetical protein
MEVALPWIDILLQNVKEEYQKDEPAVLKTEPSTEDIQYIQKVLSEPIGFDADKLIKKSLDFPLRKFQFDKYSILAYADEIEDIVKWFRIIRCLARDKPVRILYFGNLLTRFLPKNHQPIGPINVNGGYTEICSLTTIIIYRKEDAERVLIHETLHGLCSDPDLPIAQLEANTEAWAEIIWVAVMAKGVKATWTRLMKKQIEYALNQSDYVAKRHGVEDDSDYGWRYIRGRIDVWKSLGLGVDIPYKKREVKTLRLTDPTLR